MSSTAKKAPPYLSKSLLTEEQNQAISYLYERDHTLLMLPVGFGKTVVSLTAATELLAAGEMNRVLILAPLKVCQFTWKEEYLNWEHLRDTKIAFAVGSKAERCAAVESDAEIVVINFENLKWLMTEFKHLFDGKVEFQDTFDGIIVDELTKLKSVGSVGFKALRHKIKHFNWRVGMTGTLIEEGPEHLYGQVMIVDGGKTFGRSKEHFMNTYFNPTDYMRYNWELKEGAMEQLTNDIADFTFTLPSKSYDASLPKLLTDFHTVKLPDAARTVYADMAKHMITEGGVSAANAAVMTGKLQQISNGFIYDEDSNGIDLHCAKLDAITDLVGDNEQVMIVYQYRWELEQLKLRYPCAGILGGGSTKARAGKVIGAWNSNRLNILLIHPKSAGHGLNLQRGGNRIIFYSPIWSRDQTDQIIGRIRRRGQRAVNVRVTFILGGNTVDDEVIIPRVFGKGNTARLFNAHLEKLGIKKPAD